MAIEELASSLLRSLSVYCSKTHALRKILRESKLYTVILDHLLLSNNLNIVANACGILWSMSAKSTEEQVILLDLGADEKLTEMAKTSNKLISIISMATLKNLQHHKSNRKCRVPNDSNNNNCYNNSFTDSTSGLDLSVSSSSSFSFYPVLSMDQSQKKHPKQESHSIDKNNEVSISDVLNKLNNLSDISFELSEMKDLDDDASNSSLSSICSPNTSKSSSDSLVFSSDSTTSTFSNQSYELERRIKTSKIHTVNVKSFLS